MDLVIGDNNTTTGHIYLVRGQAHTGAGSNAVTATLLDSGPAIFGDRVMNIGDYDGNGQVDLAILEELGSSQGRVRVYPGSAGTYSAASSFLLTNNVTGASGDLFGRSMAQGGHPVLGLQGDIDGDGQGDLLIGSVERGTAEGSVELFYGDMPGARTRTTADHSFQPTASTGSANRTTGYIGDVDGDGFADFAIGDPKGQSGAGEFWIEH